MGNYSGSANTICPYYERETNASITCQGIIDNTYVVNKFSSGVLKKEWQESTCETYEYCNCLIASSNDKKYNDLGQLIVKQVIPKPIEIKQCKIKKAKIEKDTQLPGQMSLDDFLKMGYLK